MRQKKKKRLRRELIEKIQQARERFARRMKCTVNNAECLDCGCEYPSNAFVACPSCNEEAYTSCNVPQFWETRDEALARLINREPLTENGGTRLRR